MIMPENSEQLFEDYKIMLNRIDKKSYEVNMERFKTEYKDFFDSLFQFVKNSDDQEAAIKNASESFVNDIFNAFAVNGKIRGRKQEDLNFFMIYYVFPAILLKDDECATKICDGIRDAWNAKFKNTQINYTTYESLHDSFKTKILGLF